MKVKGYKGKRNKKTNIQTNISFLDSNEIETDPSAKQDTSTSEKKKSIRLKE